MLCFLPPWLVEGSIRVGELATSKVNSGDMLKTHNVRIHVCMQHSGIVPNLEL